MLYLEILKRVKHLILILNLANEIFLKRADKYVALSNLSKNYTWKNIKTSYMNNKFKISPPTWNGEFELSDGQYSISDNHDYLEDIYQK